MEPLRLSNLWDLKPVYYSDIKLNITILANGKHIIDPPVSCLEVGRADTLIRTARKVLNTEFPHKVSLIPPLVVPTGKHALLVRSPVVTHSMTPRCTVRRHPLVRLMLDFFFRYRSLII